MGRSRGGLTTKIHALVDAAGLPIAIKLTEGQANDGRSADDMLGSLAPGQILLGDRAYDSDARRQALAERGAWANIKPEERGGHSIEGGPRAATNHGCSGSPLGRHQ
jgi:transposase